MEVERLTAVLEATGGASLISTMRAVDASSSAARLSLNGVSTVSKEAAVATKQLGAAANEAAGATQRHTASAQENVAKLVQQRQALRANLAAYTELAAAATRGSDEQVAANTLAAQSAEKLGLAQTAAYHRTSAGIQTAEKEARGGIASFTGLGRAMFFASNAFLGGVVIGGALKSIVDKTRNTEAAMLQLRTAVTNTHTRWDASIGKTLKKQGDLSLFLKADLAQSMTRFVLSTGSVTKAETELNVATNLARTRHEDLATATQQVIMAGLGHSTVLRGLGVAIPKVTTAADALKTELAALKAAHESLTPAELAHAQALAKASDQAATGARALDVLGAKVAHGDSTFAASSKGGLAKFQHSLDELEISVGTVLIPDINRLVTSLSNWMQHLQATGQAQRDVKAAVDVLKGGFDAIRWVIETVDKVTGGFKHTLEILIGLKLAMWAGGVEQSLLGVIGGPTTGLKGANTAAKGLAANLAKLKTFSGMVVTAAVIETVIANPGQTNKNDTWSWSGLAHGFGIFSGSTWSNLLGSSNKYGQPGAGGGGGLVPNPAGAGLNSSSLFAQSLIGSLGGSSKSMAPLLAWMRMEGGSTNNTASYNFLNTTLQQGASKVMAGGSGPGVQAYPNFQAGLKATVDTLKNYPAIVHAIQTGNWSNTFELAAELSKWSGGGYSAISGIMSGPAMVPVSGSATAAASDYAAKHAHQTPGKPGSYKIPDILEAHIRAAQQAFTDAATKQHLDTLDALLATEVADLKKHGQLAKAQSVQNEIATANRKYADAHIVTGAKLLPASLNTKLKNLTAQSAADTDYAATLTGTAADNYRKVLKADLTAQAGTLQHMVDDLKAKLATSTGKQKTAIQTELTKITTQLSSVQQSVVSNLQATVASLQTQVSTIFQSIQAEMDTALGNLYYQNGLKTPSESLLASMQAADQLSSLQDTLTSAKTQLSTDTAGSILKHVLDVSTGRQWDVTNPAAAAQLAADQKAVDAAQRQIDEYQLGIKAAAERAQADKDYTTQVTSLNKQLARLEVGLENGTASVSQLKAIAAQYGIQIDTVTIPDFQDLSTAAGNLMQAFADLAAYIGKITGKTPAPVPGGGLSVSSRVAAIQASGSYQDAQALARATGMAIPMARGGIVRARPGGTLVRVGEAGQDEEIGPVGGRGGGVVVNLSVSALDPSSVDWAQIAKRLQSELLRLQRRNGGTTGIR